MHDQAQPGDLPTRDVVTSALVSIRQHEDAWQNKTRVANLGSLYELLPANDRPQRSNHKQVARAIQQMLLEVIGDIKSEEDLSPPRLGRSYSYAATLQLRLHPQPEVGGYEEARVGTIFGEITQRWKVRRNDGQLDQMRTDTFRVGHADKVLEAVGDRLLAKARDRALGPLPPSPPPSDAEDQQRPAQADETRLEQFTEDLAEPAFERAGVIHHIETLAEAPALTIFAGAGVSADIGAAAHEELMPHVLEEVAKSVTRKRTEMLPELHELAQETERAERIANVIRMIHRGSSVYLASAAYQLALERASDSDNPAQQANQEMWEAIEAINGEDRRGIAGGFLARGVAALAFSLLEAGHQIEIITTNYDSRFIDEAQHNLHKYFTEFKKNNYKLTPIVWPDATRAHNQRKSQAELFNAEYDDCKKDGKAVPVYFANGRLEARGTILGAELSYFAPTDANRAEPGRYEAREERLQKALEETDCLFVGSSVTDPDMLSRLAATIGCGRQRYAVLIAEPPQFRWPKTPDEADVTKCVRDGLAEYALARRFTEARFRHLGITPIMLDFPHQVPQFLREVGLCVQTKTKKLTYERYGTRIGKWWDGWHIHLGFPRNDNGEPGRRPLVMQMVWRYILATLRDGPVRTFLNDHAGKAARERIMIEVWLRNPHERMLKNPPPEQGVRSLFLWASSEQLWVEGDTALWGPVSIRAKEHYPAQRCFREGRTITTRLELKRGHWKYCVSVPLILHKEPWFHLPVGVVDVFSDASPPSKRGDIESQLYCVTEGSRARERSDKNDDTIAEAFEDKVKGVINEWLDTTDPLSKLRERKLQPKVTRALGLPGLRQEVEALGIRWDK